MCEVGRPLGAQHAVGARRSGRIEPHRHDVARRASRRARGQLQPIGDLLQADIRPIRDAGRVLAQSVDQETSRRDIEQRVVDRLFLPNRFLRLSPS